MILNLVNIYEAGKEQWGDKEEAICLYAMEFVSCI